MFRSYACLILLTLGPASVATAAPPPLQERHQLRMKPESAQCIIRRHGTFVQAWLRTLPGTEAEKKLVQPAESYFTSCFPLWPTAYRSSWNLAGIRHRLVEELLRERLSGSPQLALPSFSRSTWYPVEQAQDAGALPAIIANDLGFCLARTDWTSSRALVTTSGGSAEEKAALRTLVPHIAGCLPPGRKLTLDTARLRTIMMETVYHALSD
jgi:hypothetical protein